ncbi:MAG TPA: rRNA maturation RNase YbeY [Burkholderiales bacterium]|nr:rRNA maturation RNase YbeY [Burkholderiales bacterium]
MPAPASPAAPRARARRPRKARLRLHLQVVSREVRVPTSAQIRRWARVALESSAEITVRIVGAAEARILNRRYCRRDHATNVLSFSYALSRGLVQGDIVLCAPVIAREALAQGKTVEAHFAHLTVHGVLHLQGHRHAGPREAARMEALEKNLLVKLGYPDPYDAG